MKRTLFLFLFSSSLSYGFDLKKEIVKLPKDLASIKFESDKKIADVELNIDYIKFPNGQRILPKKSNKRDTIENFLENLFYAYKEKDLNEIKAFFDAEAITYFEKIEPKKINSQLDVLAVITEPKVYSIQRAYNGYIIWWKDKSFRQQRKLFIKRQIDDSFKISHFHANKDDKFFWNSSLFLRFPEFKKFSSKITNSFSKIKDNEVKTLEFNLQRAGGYLNIFKKTDTKVNLIAIDNYNYSEYVFKDLNPVPKKIKLEFSGKNFKKKGKHTLYFIESTYPLGRITKELVSIAQSIEITKE